MTRNRLGDETSPYLLQHKDNPVHWFPWGPEVFALAKEHNKPVLLSVGYAACHWCHVMAHESFEDQASAEVMNALFVNIKVDREERPDIDKIYMDAIHSLGEQGGWPLTMFLTPDGYPFWGGTYFPKTPQYGRPSFTQVLAEISRIWNEEHGKVESNAAAIHQALQRSAQAQSSGQLTADTVRDAASTILKAIDFQHGGLQGAPKFPQASIFSFLWQMQGRDPSGRLRDAATLTLTHICQGGIYDHLSGGFARYSVDHRWLAPHFEKMLYDNAQLIELLAWAHIQTGNELFRLRIEETIAWLLRDMTTPEGAFAASYDADSEGEEGKFCVWQKSEVDTLLNPDLASAFCAAYDITAAGNWEEKNIPNRLHCLELLSTEEEARLAEARAQLLQVREQRTPPGWDDKILADWNGLAISALATAGLLLERPEWIAHASSTLDVLLELLWKDNTLHQTHRAGRTQHHATADSYANLIAACLSLYQATGDQTHVEQAKALAESFNATHWNADKGGYYFSSGKAENLIVRSHYAHDDATPNANATMLRALTNLHLITGDLSYHQQAQAIHDAFASEANRVLVAHAGFIAAFDHFLEPVQAVFTGPVDDPLVMQLRQALLKQAPSSLLMIHAGKHANLPDTHAAKAIAKETGAPALYLCKGQTCSLPVSDPEAVAALFE